MRPPIVPDPAERERLAREEVEELTALLRSKPSWSDLRDQLAAEGCVASSTLLAVFMETEECEECEEFGALVTPDGRVLAFKRAQVPETLVGAMYLVSLVDITDASGTGCNDQMAIALKASAMLDSYLATQEGSAED
jgi:hypothetical protein